MKLTKEGIALIKSFEGMELEAYLDSAGVWTIGYGHAATSGRHPIPHKGMRITQDQAEEIFADDMRHFADRVRPLIKASATDAQFSALVSLAFNIGIGAFSGSTALKRFNAGDIEGAAEAMTWWNKATVNGEKKVLRGLVRRRAAEAEMLLRSPKHKTSPAKSTTVLTSGGIGTTVTAWLATNWQSLETWEKLLAVGVLAGVAWIAKERITRILRGDG